MSSELWFRVAVSSQCARGKVMLSPPLMSLDCLTEFMLTEGFL